MDKELVLLLATGKKSVIFVISRVKEGKTIFLTYNRCRTVIREHIPKKHLDFENPIQNTKVFDNTVHRIYGEDN